MYAFENFLAKQVTRFLLFSCKLPFESFNLLDFRRFQEILNGCFLKNFEFILM